MARWRDPTPGDRGPPSARGATERIRRAHEVDASHRTSFKAGQVGDAFLLDSLVRLGYLTRQGQAYVLAVQRRLRRQGRYPRVGEIVRSLELAGSDDIEEAAVAQEHIVEVARGDRIRLFKKTRRPLVDPLIIWLAALFVFLFSHFAYALPAGATASVCGFLAAAGSAFVQYWANRQWWASVFHVVRRGLPIIMAGVVIWNVLHVLGGVAWVGEAYGLSQTPRIEELRGWVSDLLLTVGLLTGVLLLAMAYIAWKYRLQRFLESRSSLLANLMFRTRECMADRSKDLFERRRVTLDLILESVRNWTRLNGWDWLREKIPFFWPGPLETVVYYFVPESEEREEGDKGNFKIAAVAWSRATPALADEMRESLVAHYRPGRWREDVFRERVRVAKGQDPRGWRDRYLKMARHPEMGSITGYVFDKQEVVVTDDASDCLAFDDSFWSRLKAAGYADDDLQWVSVRSFVACPVPGDGDEPRGVLFVAKNYTHGFGPEDEEFAVAASQMIATVLSAG